MFTNAVKTEVICSGCQAASRRSVSPLRPSARFTASVILADMTATPYGHTPSDARTCIREERLARNWTLDELAERVGVKLQTIQRWETGGRNVSVAALERVAQAFRISPRLLLPQDDLAPEERQLINFLRRAAPHEKRAVLGLAVQLSEGRQLAFEHRKTDTE
jgi:transcriptional regulator with XRE-family HTH domain